jgi:hypothetical protein
MSNLGLFFFAEFAVLALLTPPLVVLRHTIRGKFLLALLLPLAALLAALLLVRLGLWPATLLGASASAAVFRIQALAAAFSLAVAGLSAFTGRRFPLGGPLAVALLAGLILASPLWGNVLLCLSNQVVRDQSLRCLVAANPLFTVSQELGYDWIHADVLYRLAPRIGEDLPFDAASWLPLTISYGGLGLLSLLSSILVRQHGRPSAFLPLPGER